MIKLDNENYIKTIATILLDNPQTIYLACGSGGQNNIKKLLKKYDIENRFYFTGQIDAHIYGNVIDIFLDTFPHGHGESKSEFQGKGKPALHLSPEYHRFYTQQQWRLDLFEKHKSILFYKDINLIEFVIPYTMPDYIKIATRLIQDKDIRERVGKAYAFWLTITRFDVKLYAKKYPPSII